MKIEVQNEVNNNTFIIHPFNKCTVLKNPFRSQVLMFRFGNKLVLDYELGSQEFFCLELFSRLPSPTQHSIVRLNHCIVL